MLVSGAAEERPVDPFKAWAFSSLSGLVFMLFVLPGVDDLLLAGLIGVAAAAITYVFVVHLPSWCNSAGSGCRPDPLGLILPLARRPWVVVVPQMLLLGFICSLVLRLNGLAHALFWAVMLTAAHVPSTFVRAARTLPSATGWRLWCEQLRAKRLLLWVLLATPNFPLILVPQCLKAWLDLPMGGSNLIFFVALPLGFSLWHYGIVVPAAYRRLRGEST